MILYSDGEIEIQIDSADIKLIVNSAGECAIASPGAAAARKIAAALIAAASLKEQSK